jgi:transcription termination factor NusB
MFTFLDNINFVNEEISKDIVDQNSNFADTLNLYEINMCLKYIMSKLDMVEEMIQHDQYNELLEYNRAILMLMAYELKMTTMCA